MATKLIDINSLDRFKKKHDVEIDAKISNVTIQVLTMPTAASTLVGKIYQYIGTTTSSYTNGWFYRCIENIGTTPSTYEWQRVKMPSDGVWSGTKAEFNLVKDAIPIDTTIYITDDDGSPTGGNKYTDAEKTKLAGIEAGAEKNKIEHITLNGVEQTITNKTVALTVITKAVNDLANYYTKTQTYSKSEINSLINSISTGGFEVVSTLPSTDISTTTIYLVADTSPSADNTYDEYIYVNNTWEKIGSTAMDLSGYVTTTNLTSILNSYVTTTDLSTLLNQKVDKVTGKGLSTNDYTTAEKNKLAGIEAGAEENVIESITVNGTSQTVTNKNVNILIPSTADTGWMQMTLYNGATSTIIPDSSSTSEYCRPYIRRVNDVVYLRGFIDYQSLSFDKMVATYPGSTIIAPDITPHFLLAPVYDKSGYSNRSLKTDAVLFKITSSWSLICLGGLINGKDIYTFPSANISGAVVDITSSWHIRSF